MTARQAAERAARAQALADGALALFPEIKGRGDRFALLQALLYFGERQMSAGDTARGMATFHRALDLGRTIGVALGAGGWDMSNFREHLEGRLREQIDRGDFDSARATGKMLGYVDPVTHHLEAVARAQADRGDLDGARRTISRFPAGFPAKFSALGALFLAQRRLGKADAAKTTLQDALKAVEGIEFAETRDLAREWLAVGVAPGATEEARRLVERIRNERLRNQAEEQVSLAIVGAGGEAAWRVLADTQDAGLKVLFAARIAAERAKAGDRAGSDRAVRAALAALPDARRQKERRVPDPLNAAVETLVGMGAFNAAVAVSEALPDPSSPLWSVVEAQADAGDTSAALQTARRIANRRTRGQALRVVGQALRKARRHPEARDVLRQAGETLSGLLGFDHSMGEIAQGLAASGDPDGAREVLRSAWKTASGEKESVNRIGALGTLLTAQNGIVGFDPPAIRAAEARAALRSVPPDTINVSVLSHALVVFLVRTEGVEAAAAEARSLDNLRVRAVNLMEIATHRPPETPFPTRVSLAREALDVALKTAADGLGDLLDEVLVYVADPALCEDLQRYAAAVSMPYRRARILMGLALGALYPP